ncbi:MAG: hypothetical protein ABIK89_25325 [Planctomycetota bacterium]
MPETPWQEEVGRRVPTSQIIVASLVMGSFAFLVVAIVIVQRGIVEPLDEGPPLVTYIAILFAAADFIAWLIVPRVMVTRARRDIAKGTWQMPSEQGARADLDRFLEQTGDAGKLLVAFQTKTIIGSAIFEGVAFLAVIAYMLENSPLALSLAIAMIIAVAAHFPTRSGVVHWIEDQLRLIEQEQQFGR